MSVKVYEVKELLFGAAKGTWLSDAESMYLNDWVVNETKKAGEVFRIFFEKKRLDPFREHLCVLYLTAVLTPIGFEVVHSGARSGSMVDIPTIAQHCLACNAANIIICHNHPSGHLCYSKEDEETTKRLKKALELFSIGLLDHIVITNNLTEVYSIKNGSLAK